MIYLYAGKFINWTAEDQAVLEATTRGFMKLILLQVETPEGTPLSQTLKDIANLPNVYFHATEKTVQEAIKQPFHIDGKNIYAEMIVTGMYQGQVVYDFVPYKDPALKNYESWFKEKKLTGKIHNTDFDKPMADYGFSNNITQNGTKGFMNYQQGFISLENGDNKIYMSIGDLQFLAVEAQFFDQQIEKQEYPSKVCCNFMESHLKHGECEQHGAGCPDQAFTYKSKEWTLKAQNGNYAMFYCPWCGTKLEQEGRSEETFKEVVKK